MGRVYLQRVFVEGGAAAGVDAGVLPSSAVGFRRERAPEVRVMTGVPAMASPCRKTHNNDHPESKRLTLNNSW